MADTSSTSDAAPAGAVTDREAAGHGVLPKLWQVIVIALIAIAFTAVFLGAYTAMNKVIWLNNWNYITSHRWIIPLGVLSISLLVGLAQKYLHAPTVIDGGFAESMKGSEVENNYRTFPGALVSALLSLLSGASIGPEGSIAILVQDVSAWFRKKLRVSDEAAKGFDVAALASAFNGVIGSPFFTAIFATEFQVGSGAGLVYIVWNLLAGAIGFSFYVLLGLTSFAAFVQFTPVTTLEWQYFVYATILGVIGAVLAIFAGATMQVFGQLIPRLFGERLVVRALAAGTVISIVGVLIPDLLFSGEDSIHTIIADPARYGVGMLLLMAILKVLLLGLSIKSGYIGGPTFPILFSATMIALALHLVFPSVPLSILVLCIEGSAVALALSAPLTAILIVVVIGTAGANEIALVVIATVVGLIVGGAFKQLIAQRAANHTAEQGRAGRETSR